jgi:Tfp pilus assembly protein FimT
MRIKHPRTLLLATVRRASQPANSSGGFKILELILVVAISLVMLSIGLPKISTILSNMHLGSSANALASAIQSARFQAISTGCPVQLAVLYARQSGQQEYQLSAEVLTTSTPPTCAATYTSETSFNVAGGPTPFTTSDISVTTVNGVALSSSNPSVSMYFNANGTVSTTAGSAPTTFLLVLSPSNGGNTKTVNVSGVGYVKVTAP